MKVMKKWVIASFILILLVIILVVVFWGKITGNVVAEGYAELDDKDFANKVYNFMLERDATSLEVTRLTDELNTGKTKKEILLGVYGTEEFNQKYKISEMQDWEFVDFIFTKFLGIKGDASEKINYLGSLREDISRNEIILKVINRQDFEIYFSGWTGK